MSEYQVCSAKKLLFPNTLRHEEVLLHLLTYRVRVLGDYQLGKRSRHGARELLRRLEGRSLVTTRLVLVPPELPLKQPLFAWQPGDPPPHFDRLAWQLASRWQGPQRSVLIATATTKARLETGGCLGSRPLRRTEACHDLQVTALYLKFCREAPEKAARWIHEDAATHRESPQELRPDVMVGEKAIEFGGRYQAAKLRIIHRGHALAERPYEIW